MINVLGSYPSTPFTLKVFKYVLNGICFCFGSSFSTWAKILLMSFFNLSAFSFTVFLIGLGMHEIIRSANLLIFLVTCFAILPFRLFNEAIYPAVSRVGFIIGILISGTGSSRI